MSGLLQKPLTPLGLCSCPSVSWKSLCVTWVTDLWLGLEGRSPRKPCPGASTWPGPAFRQLAVLTLNSKCSHSHGLVWGT